MDWGKELGDGACTWVYEKLSSAVDEPELGVPESTLKFGSPVPADLRAEALIVLREVGPAGCLNGIGAGAVGFLSGEVLVDGGAV